MSKYHCVKYSGKPKGATGILLDMCELRARRPDIPASWFRRACKRNRVSGTKLKQFLILNFNTGYVFPLTNPFCELQWWNYDEWLSKDQRVAKGEYSYARELFTNVAVFNSFQLVSARRKMLLRMIEHLEVNND